MERETTKHNPRQDEELAHETASVTHGAPVEAHSRDERMQEDPDPGQSLDSGSRRPDVPLPGGMSEEEVDERSELARYLATATFPAHRLELLQAALGAHAPDTVTATLNRLPDSQRYASVADVWAALGGHNEAGRDRGTGSSAR